MEPVERIDYLSDEEPAPGRLALVQGLVNTVDREHGREMLSSPERLRAVLAGLGLVAADAPVDGRDLARALEVREALRQLALANNGGPPAPEAERVLERAVAADCLALRFRDGNAVLEGRGGGVAAALATLAAAVAEATADGTWPRLKACPSELCGWLFYDRSRNRSARWCDMAVCGNRTKTRAYRARARRAPAT